MPTYDYRCPNGHEFEHFFRKISDAAAELACPVCGATAVRLVSGGAGLVFKGSGFYLTDYGKNAHRRSAPDGAKGDKKAAESKPEPAKSDAGSGPSDGGSSSGSAKSEPGAKSESASPAKRTGGDAQ